MLQGNFFKKGYAVRMSRELKIERMKEIEEKQE